MTAFDEAKKMLDYVVARAFDGFTEGGPWNLPTRRYVTQGQAVYDCEQVAATMVALNTGLPAQVTPGGNMIANCPPIWNLIVEVAIVRCHPTAGDDGTPPKVEKYNESAQKTAKDAEILMRAANSRADEMFGAVTATLQFPPPTDMTATVCRYTIALST